MQNNPLGPPNPVMLREENNLPPNPRQVLNSFNDADERAKVEAAVNAKSKS